VPPSSWFWIILEVVAFYKCNILIYIRNNYVVFSHLGFHIKSMCTMSFVIDMVNFLNCV
jgi:hypothetical protein